MVSSISELKRPTAESSQAENEGWTVIESPRTFRRESPRTSHQTAAVVAAKRAHLRRVLERIPSQDDQGDLSLLVDEHREMEPRRRRANGETLA